ncbi:hypothetical protein AB0H36_05120 [Kribbella sp. NPDC050820]|uniref:hypothetical protein n=1 Tax=Kribbella sp. NPDC050820 TaxID=3155408 RepID=UPI00340C071A
MDDLEAFATGYAASLRVTRDNGSPLESATAQLNIFALADAPGLLQWAAVELGAMIADGPEAAGFSAEQTRTGVAYQQLARPAIPADPERLATFDTLQDLRDAAVAAGLPLTAWIEDPTPLPGTESGRCSDSSYLVRFESVGAQLEVVERVRAVLPELRSSDGEPWPVLVGPNWMIFAREAENLGQVPGSGVVLRDPGLGLGGECG